MAKVECDNRGMKALERRLRAVTSSEVDAGVISGQKHPKYDGTIAGLAALWHYGFTRRGTDYESDFFDPLLWFNVMKDRELKKKLQVYVDQYLQGRLSNDELLSVVGEHLSEQLRDHISQNKANIIASGKGRYKTDGITMVDSGELIEAIRYEVK